MRATVAMAWWPPSTTVLSVQTTLSRASCAMPWRRYNLCPRPMRPLWQHRRLHLHRIQVRLLTNPLKTPLLDFRHVDLTKDIYSRMPTELHLCVLWGRYLCDDHANPQFIMISMILGLGQLELVISLSYHTVRCIFIQYRDRI